MAQLPVQLLAYLNKEWPNYLYSYWHICSLPPQCWCHWDKLCMTSAWECPGTSHWGTVCTSYWTLCTGRRGSPLKHIKYKFCFKNKKIKKIKQHTNTQPHTQTRTKNLDMHTLTHTSARQSIYSLTCILEAAHEFINNMILKLYFLPFFPSPIHPYFVV